MRRSVLVAVALLLTLGAGPSPGRAADATTDTLESGLRVTVRPLASGTQVAIVVAYDVGEDHDPEGKSGLSHLVEHCYVTSAAGSTPARTAEQLMRRYPQAWNAQTGRRYTVFAVVAPPDRLEAELAEAAARMGTLEITQADLDREIPRMKVELANMFDSPSGLAASNRAWELARPSPGSGRKGGVVAQIEALTLGDVRAWHAKHYKPGNAHLVLAGPLDAEKAKALVEKHFGGVARGEVPTAREPPAAESAPLEEAGRRGGWIARAWRAPAWNDPTYPAFLVLARRLMTQGRPHGVGVPADRPTSQFAPLDHPEVLTIVRRVAPEESSAEAEAALDAWWQGVVDAPLEADEGLHTATEFGWLLGTFAWPDRTLAMNPYGVAFGLARREQLGLDGALLGRRLAGVDQAALDAAVEGVLTRDAGRAAVVVDPQPAR